MPTTKRQAAELLAELDSLLPVDQARELQDDGDLGPQKTGENIMSDDDELELGQSGLEETREPVLEDGVETVTGKLEQVSTKEGRSAKGPWKRYGLRVGTEWFNTFDKILGELALKDKGHAVRIQFRRGEKGNDLVSIERPAK